MAHNARCGGQKEKDRAHRVQGLVLADIWYAARPIGQKFLKTSVWYRGSLNFNSTLPRRWPYPSNKILCLSADVGRDSVPPTKDKFHRLLPVATNERWLKIKNGKLYDLLGSPNSNGGTSTHWNRYARACNTAVDSKIKRRIEREKEK